MMEEGAMMSNVFQQVLETYKESGVKQGEESGIKKGKEIGILRARQSK
jgi:hypothetical protein